MKLSKVHFQLVVFCTMIILNFLLLGSVYSQSNSRSEVVAMFKSGVVTLSAGKTYAVINELKISSPQIKTALSQNNVQFISKAFPKFSLTDTLGIS